MMQSFCRYSCDAVKLYCASMWFICSLALCLIVIDLYRLLASVFCFVNAYS